MPCKMKQQSFWREKSEFRMVLEKIFFFPKKNTVLLVKRTSLTLHWCVVHARSALSKGYVQKTAEASKDFSPLKRRNKINRLYGQVLFGKGKKNESIFCVVVGEWKDALDPYETRSGVQNAMTWVVVTQQARGSRGHFRLFVPLRCVCVFSCPRRSFPHSVTSSILPCPFFVVIPSPHPQMKERARKTK